jgi:transposase InsO family protein
MYSRPPSYSNCFLIRAVGWFAKYGVMINRVMTDNGSGYSSHIFLITCHNFGAKSIKTKPYTPRINGMAERSIQTSSREWAYKQAYESSAERDAARFPRL